MNGLFHSGSTRWNVGEPIRLHCISNIIDGSNGDENAEQLSRRLGYTGLKVDHQKGVRSFVNDRDVLESLTTDSRKFEFQ